MTDKLALDQKTIGHIQDHTAMMMLQQQANLQLAMSNIIFKIEKATSQVMEETTNAICRQLIECKTIQEVRDIIEPILNQEKEA